MSTCGTGGCVLGDRDHPRGCFDSAGEPLARRVSRGFTIPCGPAEVSARATLRRAEASIADQRAYFGTSLDVFRVASGDLSPDERNVIDRENRSLDFDGIGNAVHPPDPLLHRCSECARVSGLPDLGVAVVVRERYTRAGNTLADAAQLVRAERDEALIENAQLRRRVEKLERATKKGGSR